MDTPDIKSFLHHYLNLAVGVLDPVPGKQFVLAGAEVPWDQCDCDGQVWSRLVNIQPIVANTKANGQPCTILRWDVTLAVGVIRCVAQPSTSGKLPSGAKMTLDGDQAATDVANITQGLVCDPLVSLVTGVVPIGPGGACAGSEATFMIKVRPCGCD